MVILQPLRHSFMLTFVRGSTSHPAVNVQPRAREWEFSAGGDPASDSFNQATVAAHRTVSVSVQLVLRQLYLLSNRTTL